MSDTIGILQHVASLVVNYTLCLDPTVIKDFKSIKTIFDKGITASEIALGLKGESSTNKNNPFVPVAKDVISKSLSTVDVASMEIRPVPFDVRQQSAVEMATATVRHLGMLRERLIHLFKAELKSQKASDPLIPRLAYRMSLAIMASPEKEVQSPSGVDANLAAFMSRRVAEERSAFGVLVTETCLLGGETEEGWRSRSKDESSGANIGQW